MAKAKTHYVCTECGSIHPKWSGQCSDCGEWNTLQEEDIIVTAPADKAPHRAGYAGEVGRIKSVSEVDIKEETRTYTCLLYTSDAADE